MRVPVGWTHHVRHRIAALFSTFSTLLLVAPALAHGQTVTAAWDPSPAADQVTGYQVCVGTSSLACNFALASVSASTRTYRFTPAGGTFYYVAARATNAAGASPYSSEVRFSIPSFAQPGNQTSTAGSPIATLNLSIADPDGSPLTITHTGLPVGLTIDSAQRRITGTPSAAGTHNVTVFVNDGLVTVSRSFTWTVAAPVIDTLAPLLTITSHASGLTVMRPTVTIAGEATDSQRGGRGITSVTVNGIAVTAGTATGNNMAGWSRLVTLSTGVNTITVQATDGAGNVSMQQITLTRTTQVCRNTGDFNGDCKADLIWRNTVGGQTLVWYLNGTTVVGYASLPTVDPAWQLATSADLNRDGTADLIWRNRTNGQNVVWYFTGSTYAGEGRLPTVASPEWQLVASTDINRDGAPDLIWRNNASGQSLVWYLHGTSVVGIASFDTVADLTWQLVASADVNQDGAPDLIWRNSASGQNLIRYMNGTTVAWESWLPTVEDPAWRLAAALDTDNDGDIELIWRYDLNGANYIWYLDKTTVVGGGYLPTVSDRTWGMIGVR
jgi:hypothetical protein